MFGYIYLLQTRESYKCDESIYKIGRTTKDALNRFNNYPKGSLLYIHMYTLDCKSTERRLIDIFNTKYTNVSQYGYEYFEGDLQDMMNTIYREVNATGACKSSISKLHKEFQRLTNHNDMLHSQNIDLKNQLNELTISNKESINQLSALVAKLTCNDTGVSIESVKPDQIWVMKDKVCTQKNSFCNRNACTQTQLSVPMRVGDGLRTFVEENLEKCSHSYITLKQIKLLIEGGDYRYVDTGRTLRPLLEDILSVRCVEQKRIGVKLVRSYFSGYKLKTDDGTSIKDKKAVQY